MSEPHNNSSLAKSARPVPVTPVVHTALGQSVDFLAFPPQDKLDAFKLRSPVDRLPEDGSTPADVPRRTLQIESIDSPAVGGSTTTTSSTSTSSPTYPPSTASPVSATNANSQIFERFIGSLIFEMTEELLAWSLHHLTDGEVTCRKVTRRGRGGCFIVEVGSAWETTCLDRLKDKVLCETFGLWYARSPAAQLRLNQYITTELPQLVAKAGKLNVPLHTMMVKENMVPSSTSPEPPATPDSGGEASTADAVKPS